MSIVPVRMRTLVVFGAGYLLGSRAGTGPWERAVAVVREFSGGDAKENSSSEARRKAAGLGSSAV